MASTATREHLASHKLWWIGPLAIVIARDEISTRICEFAVCEGEQDPRSFVHALMLY